MMLPGHFKALRLGVANHMIAYCLEHNICVETNYTHSAICGAIKKPASVNTITLGVEELMFGGMDRMKMPQWLTGETDQDPINLKMEMEIGLYLYTPGIPLRGKNREFTDPLV